MKPDSSPIPMPETPPTRRDFVAGIGAGRVAWGQPARHRPPNLVLIITDNQAAGTLGCYGNDGVRTPNLDGLARAGVLFTRALAVNAVCSPTRASLLTGLMPSQHGVHTYLGAGGAQIGPAAYNTISEFTTLPGVLVEAGYVAGLSGKWHLGGNLRPQCGFSYWITKPHGHSPGFYGQEVIEDGKIRVEPGYLTDLWTEHGIRFIERNRDRPFFLYLAYNGPYGLGTAMREPIRNRHAAYYAGQDLPWFPRDNPHPWLVNNRDFTLDPQVRRKYAAEISGIDDGVGRVLETLRRLGLEDNTLVVFTADQGLATGQSGFWGMGDHTRPLTAFNGTMSIPLIFRHPGRITAKLSSDLMVNTCDILPTVLHCLGLESKVPPQSPGRDFSPLLRGGTMPWQNVTYFEFENVRAIRTPEWQYVERIYQGPNELYDLRNDAGERLNLCGRPAAAEVRRELRQRLYAFFDRHANPKWDLWKGGKSKADLLTANFFGLKNPYQDSRYLPGPGEGIGRWKP